MHKVDPARSNEHHNHPNALPDTGPNSRAVAGLDRAVVDPPTRSSFPRLPEGPAGGHRFRIRSDRTELWNRY
ncbi:hypothetical protein GCM10027444_08120 [Actinopolyspora lacussalsi]